MPERDRETSDPLQVVVEPDLQGVRIGLVGELDLATVPEVDRLMEQLADERHERLLLDLERLTFMDSTGLAAIIRAVRCAEANGHRLTFRPGPPQVQRLLELTGTLPRLTFEA